MGVRLDMFLQYKNYYALKYITFCAKISDGMF